MLKKLDEDDLQQDYNEWSRFGFMAALVVNMNRRKGTKAATIDDFIKNPLEKLEPKHDIDQAKRDYEELKKRFGE